MKLAERLSVSQAPCLPYSVAREIVPIFRQLQSKVQKEVIGTIVLGLRFIRPTDTNSIKYVEIKIDEC